MKTSIAPLLHLRVSLSHCLRVFTLALLLAPCSLPHIFAQGGSLTPPGAPAPTMKTLDQLEPRTDLFNAPASAVTTTDASYHYIITKPGSYYLSGNLGTTKNNGIKIDAAGVTLDLCGFEVARVSGSGIFGIEITATSHRATVRGGAVRGFLNALQDGGASGGHYAQLAVSDCTNAPINALGTGVIVESCRVVNCIGTPGIQVGQGSTIVGCTVTGCTLNTGINTADGCSVLRCVVTNNTVGAAFQVSGGCLVSECVAQNNTSAGAFSAGIQAASNSTVTHCTSSGNKSTAGTLTNVTGMGFTLGTGCLIEHCTASGNQGNGIRLAGRDVARHNQCEGNGASGDGAGIHAFNFDNCIDSNNVTNNDRGIDVDNGGNFIVRNTASGNGVNYDIVAANRDAQVIAPGTAFVSTDPWANFAY